MTGEIEPRRDLSPGKQRELTWQLTTRRMISSASTEACSC
jgi:hypothetical protein